MLCVEDFFLFLLFCSIPIERLRNMCFCSIYHSFKYQIVTELISLLMAMVQNCCMAENCNYFIFNLWYFTTIWFEPCLPYKFIEQYTKTLHIRQYIDTPTFHIRKRNFHLIIKYSNAPMCVFYENKKR